MQYISINETFIFLKIILISLVVCVKIQTNKRYNTHTLRISSHAEIYINNKIFHIHNVNRN